MVIVQYSHTEDVDDDGVLTKPLSRVKFEHFQDKLGVVRKDLPRRGSSDVAKGLYRPGTSVHNRSDGFGPRECGRIASSLGICPEVIRRPQSSRMKRDCIILGHLSTID